MGLFSRMMICFAGLVGWGLVNCLIADDASPREESLQQSYRQLDRDQSGDVTPAEFLADISDNLQKAAQHDFRLADFDRDGKLTLPEYLALRGFAVPDPWVELAAAALANWQRLLREADRNQDGQLSSAEWPEPMLFDALKPLGELEFAQWDADRNGQVNPAEAQQVMEAAYGLRHPDGTPLRLANGDAVFFSYYRDLDRNRDGVVSEAEFVAVHWMGEERNTAYFTQIDADRDGRLSPREFARAERLLTHSFDAFRQLDADFDGLVSEEELAKQSPPVQNQRRRLKLGFSPFDEDRDGKFSFREFRLAPVGELYVMVDLLQRIDPNRDGGIAWNEFDTDGDPLLIGVAWEVFRRYDRNSDGRLTVEEYEFPVDGSPQAIADLFRVQDEDASGGLTLAEFLSLTPANQRKLAERDFKVMDFDRTGTLSREEFAAAKGRPVPDPWRKQADATQEALWKLLLAADANGDQEISHEEWPAKELHAAFQPFGEVEFAKWDADQDGRVHQNDAMRMVYYAFGMITSEGSLARWSDGSVLNFEHLTHFDRDGDGSIPEAELIDKHHWLGLSKALFQELDQDGDQRLSIKELTVKDSPLRVNLVAKFLEFDRDLDGRLDHAELAQHCPPAQNNPRGLKLGLAAFDRDGDGFDLDEFRMSPIGTLNVTVELHNRKDANQDGVISWTEFHPAPNPQFAGIAWEVFRRYDRDGDGELTTDEYDFPEDPQIRQFVQQVTPEVRETLKAELRFFLSICPINAVERQALKLELAGIMNIVSRRMAGAKRQLTASSINLQSPPDAQKLIASRLATFAEQHLAADAAASYREEMAARRKQQQRAAILFLVSRLDQALLLSGDQRQKISESLSAHWQPVWGQQIEMLLQNDQMLLQLPDDCLIPHLSSTQKDVWRQWPNKMTPGPGNRVRLFGDVAENGGRDDLADLMPPVPVANEAPRRARAARIRAVEERKVKKVEK